MSEKWILFRHAHIHTCKEGRKVPFWERDAPGELGSSEQVLIIAPIFAQMLELCCEQWCPLKVLC